jgi:predicted AAA+ superfamily ATPase
MLSALPSQIIPSFYRTAAGAEIDLVLETKRHGILAIEIKSGLSPKLERGFHHACSDLKPSHKYIVYAGEDNYPIDKNLEVISLRGMCEKLSSL